MRTGWALRPLPTYAGTEWPVNCLPPPLTATTHPQFRRVVHPPLSGRPRSPNVPLPPRGRRGIGVSRPFLKGRVGVTFPSHRPQSLKSLKRRRNQEKLPPQLNGSRGKQNLEGPPRDPPPPLQGVSLEGNFLIPLSPLAEARPPGRPPARSYPGRSHLPWSRGKDRYMRPSPRTSTISGRS